MILHGQRPKLQDFCCSPFWNLKRRRHDLARLLWIVSLAQSDLHSVSIWTIEVKIAISKHFEQHHPTLYVICFGKKSHQDAKGIDRCLWRLETQKIHFASWLQTKIMLLQPHNHGSKGLCPLLQNKGMVVCDLWHCCIATPVESQILSGHRKEA